LQSKSKGLLGVDRGNPGSWPTNRYTPTYKTCQFLPLESMLRLSDLLQVQYPSKEPVSAFNSTTALPQSVPFSPPARPSVRRSSAMPAPPRTSLTPVRILKPYSGYRSSLSRPLSYLSTSPPGRQLDHRSTGRRYTDPSHTSLTPV
jgi:hypothetical protein